MINDDYPEYKELLDNFRLTRTNKAAIYGLSWEKKNLNYKYGRTKEQMIEKAKDLYGEMRKRGVTISLDECIECVRYRTICETWNGVIIRERNTIKTLKGLLPHLQFKKTTGDFDYTYGVDYEVLDGNKLLFGLQIKPYSYFTSNAPYLIKARNANGRKNSLYKENTGCYVYNIASNSSGKIYNQEVIAQFKR